MDGNEFSTGDRRSAQQLIVSYGGMAFTRRGQRTEQALQLVVERLRLQREEMLDMVRLRLATVVALIGGEWTRLEAFLSAAEIASLQHAETELHPRLRAPLDPVQRDRPIRVALGELQESIARFNRRWMEVLVQTDLSDVNRTRDEYNRHYLIEKECAIGSALLAKREFQRLEPLSAKDLQSIVPLLNEFEFRERS
ncbi:MAG: hypothetical protein U0744_10705 [Gemmataceae bacterium]